MMPTVFDCTAYGRLGRCCRMIFYSTNVFSGCICLSTAGVGLWLAMEKAIFSPLFEPTLYVSVAYLLIIIGSISTIVNWIGIYATNRELRCLMYSYSVTSLILFLMLFISGIMGFVFQYQVKQSALNLQMLTALQNFYGQPHYSSVTRAFDVLQTEFKCCGIDNNRHENYKIWRTAKWHMDDKSAQKKQVPLSCCVQINSQYLDARKCQSGDLKSENSTIYTEGCYKPFLNELEKISTTEAWLGIFSSLSLIPPAISAAFFARLIQK